MPEEIAREMMPEKHGWPTLGGRDRFPPPDRERDTPERHHPILPENDEAGIGLDGDETRDKDRPGHGPDEKGGRREETA